MRTDPATALAETLTVLGPLTRNEAVSFQGVSVRSRGFRSRLEPSRASLTVLAFGLEASEVAVGRADRVAVPLATVEHAARIKARLALTSDRMNRAVPSLGRLPADRGRPGRSSPWTGSGVLCCPTWTRTGSAGCSPRPGTAS